MDEGLEEFYEDRESYYGQHVDVDTDDRADDVPERDEDMEAAEEAYERDEREAAERAEDVVDATHRIKSFDPADYTTTGLLWPSDSEEGGEMWIGMSAYEKEELDAARNEITARGEDFFKCAHCGNHLRWVHIVKHLPTETLISFGGTCIERVSIPTREGFREMMSEFGRKSWAERGKRIARMQRYCELEPVRAAYISIGCMSGNGFMESLRNGIRLYGSLTTGQAGALDTSMMEAALGIGRLMPRAPEPNPTEPVIEGRRVITGVIVTVKLQEDEDYGDTWKMLVQEDDENRVWGTVPSTLYGFQGEGSLWIHATELRGKRVSFTARVERSHKDEHFGFYKRPTKADIVQNEQEVLV